MTDQIKKLLEYQEADSNVDAAEKKVKGSKERKTANAMKQRYELAVEERKKLIGARDAAEKEVDAMAKAIEDVMIEQGDNFTGGKSIVKEYISSHQYLVPAPRQAVEPRRKHRLRYFTGSGEGDIKTAQSASV